MTATLKKANTQFEGNIGNWYFEKRGDASELRLPIKGFASLEGEDRHGEALDPALFTEAIPRFLKGNPQFLVNHRPFMKGGNPTTPGLVTEMCVVKACIGAEGDLSVRDLANGDEIDHVSAEVTAENFADVADGQCGVWIKAEVYEPEVIKCIEDGRYRKLSWRGKGKTSNGVLKSVDIWEVSAVSVPAHPNASFIIAKGIHKMEEQLVGVLAGLGQPVQYVDKSTLDMSNMSKEYLSEPRFFAEFVDMEGNRVSVSVKPTDPEAARNSVMEMAKQIGVREIRLLENTFRKTADGASVLDIVTHVIPEAPNGMTEIEKAALLGGTHTVPPNHTPEGGEHTMSKKLEETLEEISKSVQTVGATVTALMGAIEAGIKKSTDEAETEPAKEEEAAKEDEVSKGVEEALATIAKSIEGVHTTLGALEARMKKVEDAPASSQDISKSVDGGNTVKQVDPNALVSKFNKLEAPARKELALSAVTSALLPSAVRRRA